MRDIILQNDFESELGRDVIARLEGCIKEIFDIRRQAIENSTGFGRDAQMSRQEMAVANRERRFFNVSSHRISADIGSDLQDKSPITSIRASASLKIVYKRVESFLQMAETLLIALAGRI